jgi:hypothetical protein
MAAKTKKKETKRGNQDNSFKHRNNPEKHVVYKRNLKIQPLPLERRPQELPSPSCLPPQFLEENPPILLNTHFTFSLSPFPKRLLLGPLVFWVGREVFYIVARAMWEGSVFLKEYGSVGTFWTMGGVKKSFQALSMGVLVSC